MTVQKLLNQANIKNKFDSVCIFNHGETEVITFYTDLPWEDKKILDELIKKYGRKAIAGWSLQDSDERIGYLTVVIHLV